MEGRQLPWVTLAEDRVWPNLEGDFPGITAVFRRLAGTMEKVFNRKIDLIDRSVAVYSTGRLACEDFVEIAFLAEHGYGFAALKLLRGIYERTVVGRYIASHPDEAERFHDYKVIDAQKFSSRASGVYGSDWDPLVDPERQTQYEDAKKKFKCEPCPQCGRPPQDSFTRLSLPAMARAIKLTDREAAGQWLDGSEADSGLLVAKGEAFRSAPPVSTRCPAGGTTRRKRPGRQQSQGSKSESSGAKWCHQADIG